LLTTYAIDCEKRMSHNSGIRHIADRAALYWICLYGHVTPDRCDQLAGMQATLIDAGGELPMTILTGRLPDQAALAGVLTCLYEYGLALISVERREAELFPRR
jgi:hypothetical protein